MYTPCRARFRHAAYCELTKITPSTAVSVSHNPYWLSFARFKERFEISIVTLLSKITAVLIHSTFGITSGVQSFDDAMRTMYALVSAVNSITMLAIATQMPTR